MIHAKLIKKLIKSIIGDIADSNPLMRYETDPDPVDIGTDLEAGDVPLE
jgi:hypothetical protein